MNLYFIICKQPIKFDNVKQPNTAFSMIYFLASCQLSPEKFPVKEDNKNKADQGKAKPRKIVLNSGEGLYAEIRDMNFSAVGPVLSREAKRITAEYEVRMNCFMDFVHF